MRGFQVPVIAVFTKFDQFSRDIGMKLEDQGRDPDDLSLVNVEMERIFNEEFLINLKGSPPVIRLESEDIHQPAFILLIAILQECTSPVNGVLILLKRLQMHSPATPWLSCC